MPESDPKQNIFSPAETEACLINALPSPSHNPGSVWNAAGQTLNVDEIDSGHALEAATNLYLARIRQLKSEISASKRENENVVDETLIQTLELITLNKNLECKVKERTRDLEIANEKLQELSQAKDALTHMIIHDMKNPLTAILGTLLLFTKNSFGLKPDMHQVVLGAHSNAIKLLSMIEQILMISRMQTKEFRLKPERVDLIQVIKQSMDLMVQTTGPKSVTLRLLRPEAELMMVLDVQIIERVINNLLNNAIKYAPAKSEITVEAVREQTNAMVCVSNWGDAIPPQDQARIFELFSRTKGDDSQFSGTGLGLAFCKLAVEAHGGSIEVKSPLSPEGRGARFGFSLPMNVDDLAATQSAA